MFQAYLLALPRIYLIFTIMPMMGKNVLGGAMVRNGILLSLSLFIFPLNEGNIPAMLTRIDYLSLMLKEGAIGLVVGLVIAVPFWVAEGVGTLIDNQRGSTMSNVVNPLLGDDSSPLGIYLTQLLNTFFIISGAFLLMLGVIYQSFVYWPVGQMLPLNLEGTDVYLLAQLDFLTRSIVLFSAPVVIAMFLAEFTLALISRFSPQLNVFFLAMPIKSAIAILVLIIYVRVLLAHIDGIFDGIFADMRFFMETILSAAP
ncbi:MAG: type III secretion system export apparatus subunit SctT [Alteromonadaceae bacterium]|nr:type III secretion system export apparatus subunit SctT [Alteromonadaceae bacterium]